MKSTSIMARHLSAIQTEKVVNNQNIYQIKS